MLLRSANLKRVAGEGPSNNRSEHRTAARALMAANRFFARVYHKLEVLSPCQLPDSGPAILICNHTSFLDPQLIQAVCPRLITWMMAAEYYDLRGISLIFRAVGVIPVTRSGRDTPATRTALRALHQGQILGVFPEGKIEKSDELLPFQTGVAMMAMKTAVPVYPAYLDGSQRRTELVPALLHRQESTIAFGPQVHFDRQNNGRDGLEHAIGAMTEAVEDLRQFSHKTRHDRGL